jgi:dephospho-CoA kinase
MIVGLTGGIASGKSTVSKMFKELGAEIIDADIKAKEISQREDVVSEMKNIFGNKILLVRVLEMKDSTKKEDATKMYEIIKETKVEVDG